MKKGPGLTQWCWWWCVLIFVMTANADEDLTTNEPVISGNDTLNGSTEIPNNASSSEIVLLETEMLDTNGHSSVDENEIDSGLSKKLQNAVSSDNEISWRDNMWRIWTASPKLPMFSMNGISLVPNSFDLFDLKKMLVGESFGL